jgi:hypothetical protein
MAFPPSVETAIEERKVHTPSVSHDLSLPREEEIVTALFETSD